MEWSRLAGWRLEGLAGVFAGTLILESAGTAYMSPRGVDSGQVLEDDQSKMG